MTYADLAAALRVFGYTTDDRPTHFQVKGRHRELVRRHHSDFGGVSPEKIQAVNAAAATIMSYLESYGFSFSEDEFYLQNPDEQLAMQFGCDPWGTR